MAIFWSVRYGKALVSPWASGLSHNSNPKLDLIIVLLRSRRTRLPHSRGKIIFSSKGFCYKLLFLDGYPYLLEAS
ncbi:hypothetical protein AMATHDRAFT_55234, partial [Amanita thiersii Skay4041]